jgi:hypothetical protein
MRETYQRRTISLAVTLLSLLVGVQAQTARLTTVNVTSDGVRVRIAAQGDVSEMRVDVADEMGDVLFQSGQITGQTLDWKMTDASGERVAPGTYLVTVTFRNAAGKLRKRVEQVTVDEAENSNTTADGTPQAAQEAVTTSNAGVFGTIARFTGESTIANSLISQNSEGKIGIGITPTSQTTGKLTVAGQIQMTGTPATTGIKFSDGTVQKSAAVGDIKGVTAGTGLSGGGETGAVTLNIASGGVGTAQLANGAVTGAKIAVPLSLSGSSASSILSVTNNTGGSGVGITGQSNNGTGVFAVTTTGTGLMGSSLGSGYGVRGFSSSGYAGYFEGKSKFIGNVEVGGNLRIGTDSDSTYKLQVKGVTSASNDGLISAEAHGVGAGLYAENFGEGIGAYGFSSQGHGVHGQSSTGYAVFSSGKTKVTGKLEVDGNTGLGTSTPKARLHVTGGNIFIAQPNSLVITSPNGSCWFVRVTNEGTLSASSITCP